MDGAANRGRIMSPSHTHIETALGELTLVATGGALTGVYFPHHWYRPSRASLGELVEPGVEAILTQAAVELSEYLAGDRVSFTVPFATAGDPFQEQVWRRLLDIPRGTTTTYGALAEELGGLALAQQVGQAVGHNPLSIIVPCHRVVGADGSLTGYAGGLARKQFLLDLEERAEVAAGRLF
jgi:methylated-DNA-[protein]-cysteine S-methyltransferase